jgi:hypothetical protein
LIVAPYLSVLSAAGRILRKLQLYYVINGDKAYEGNRVASELGINESIADDAIKVLRENKLVSYDGKSIRLTEIAIDASALRPEELIYRPRFHSIIEAAMTCLDPEKGGVLFEKSAFVMMGYDEVTDKLRQPIRDACKNFGLTARFADKRAYADQIWDNVVCYALCSKYGIALFHQPTNTRSKSKYSNYSVSYNLNVALEVGAMLSWGRSCCLLKDKSLPQLQTDLVGWIYRECDFKEPGSVISRIESFFYEKGLKNE